MSRKISQFPDGGSPQDGDDFVIARAGSNFGILWSSAKTALNLLYVALTGNQTIAGIKSFSSFPITPSAAPTTDYQVANKKYVDDEIAELVVFGQYQLVPSISANDLVLELFDLDGDDFSASNPLYIKLYDEKATITAALSITKADATNWAALGSAELATKEVDLFAYLIKETGASAGIKLGWSRIPYGTVVGDFSSTTTNEKYLAGPTNYNATDKVQNIGRFSAILSAGAGYTWTLPATSVIKNEPTYETRWLAWTPTKTNFTVTSEVAEYTIRGEDLVFRYNAVIDGVTGTMSASLPFTIVNTATNPLIGYGFLLETGVASYPCQEIAQSGTTFAFAAFATGVSYTAQAYAAANIPFVWAASDEFQTTGRYEIN